MTDQSEREFKWKRTDSYGVPFLISTNGDVVNFQTGETIAPYASGKGYRRISLKGKQVFVHRLVLETFVGPSGSLPLCRHLNGNPSDNRLLNLKWGTHAENEADKRQHGTVLIGAKNPMTKDLQLTAELISEINNSSLSNERAAIHFSLSYGTIQSIRSGNHWSVGGEAKERNIVDRDEYGRMLVCRNGHQMTDANRSIDSGRCLACSRATRKAKRLAKRMERQNVR